MHKTHMLTLMIGTCLGGVALAQTPPPPSAAATPPAATAVAQQALPAAATPAVAGALSEDAIKSRIAEAGFKTVKGLTFDDGVWRTEARGGNDKWVELAVGPVTGKVYLADAPSQLNADEITAKLSAAGYQHIHDVQFDDGLWSADATDARGVDVDLLVDPDNGSVVSSQSD